MILTTYFVGLLVAGGLSYLSGQPTAGWVLAVWCVLFVVCLGFRV